MIFAIASIALGGVVAAAGLIAALWRAATLRRARGAPDAAALAILPLTGPQPRLAALVNELAAQAPPPSALILAVEAEADPAWSAAARVAAEADAPFPIHVAVAGPATQSGQKCANQRAALALADALGLEWDAVALLDADIRVPPGWLAAIAQPLVSGKSDLVTGYRWQIPTPGGLGAQVVAALDRPFAALPQGAGPIVMAWGGTLGLSRAAARAIDLPAVLATALTDDLAIAAAARRRGLTIWKRGALLVPSPAGHDLGAAWRFARRQYQLVRIYAPTAYAAALVSVTARVGGWVGVGAAALHGQATLAAIAGGALLALSVLRARVLARIGARLGAPDPPATQAAQLGLALAAPVVDLFHLAIVLGGAWARAVRWAHLCYRVRGPTRIEVVARAPWSPSSHR